MNSKSSLENLSTLKAPSTEASTENGGSTDQWSEKFSGIIGPNILHGFKGCRDEFSRNALEEMAKKLAAQLDNYTQMGLQKAWITDNWPAYTPWFRSVLRKTVPLECPPVTGKRGLWRKKP